jgi:aminoglycoside phosphotransferase (APT) family kinase protein
MPRIDMSEVLDTLALRADTGAPAPTGGMSGSHVVGAFTDHDVPVVVKVTALELPDEARRAWRELEVYTDLSQRLPLPAPRLVAAYSTDGWIAIALERHRPAPPASRWTMERWIILATTLGELHGAGRRVLGLPLSADAVTSRSTEEISGVARQLWNGPADADRIRTVLDARERLHEVVSNEPASFVHGDCHLGNVVLNADGKPLLVDWQSAQFGPSAADVAFALTRASAGSESIPRDLVIDTYSAAADTDPAAVHRAVTAKQLLILVEQYPEFAAFLGPDEVTGLRRAFDVLLEEWEERG